MRGARVRAGTSASSANASPLARMGTKDTAAGSNPSTYNQLNNPNVEPATPTKSRTAAQAARNAGVGHAQNGLPMAPLGRVQATRTKGLLAITRPEHICSRNTGQRKQRCGSRNNWSADRNVWEGHQSFGPGERATRRASWR
jgi:hypothetical protein